ncbi:MAG: ABC transporter ATP-binding protein/permease [Microthrixaceae bacterium]|nr:ABC transporter ATP-binding protein/permease [Microthrixaceae bacterium]
MVTEASEFASPSLAVAVRSLYGRRLWILPAIAASAIAGGLAEAGFLLIITKVGLAAAAGEHAVVLAGQSRVSLEAAAFAAGLLVLGRIGFGVLGGRLNAANTARTVARVRRDLSSAYLQATWGTQQTSGVGQLQDLLTTFTGQIGALLNAISSSVVSIFNLSAMLLLSVAVEPAASIGIIVLVGLLALLLRPIRGVVWRRAARAAALNLSFASSLSEISDLGMEYHVFHVQAAVEEQVGNLISMSEETDERLLFAQSLTPTIYTGLAYVAVLIGLGGVILYGGNDMSSVGAVMLVMLRSLSYGQGLQIASSAVQAALPFHAMLDRRLAEFRAAVRVDDGLSVGDVGQIEFDDVAFEYEPGTPVLRDLAFSLGPQEVVGIMGPSGGGKSTLVQLMLGLREPTRGRVLLGGVEVGALDRSQLARKVTFVPQDAHLFNGTVEDNIRFMRSHITREAIVEACRSANLWADVEGFAEGLDRWVGDRGDHLSGGQKQRLTIARALVERPDVIILDEPTSALDVQSEQLIRDTLTKLSDTMSVIIIAHRLSTLEFCDRIMVVQSGRVVALDTADALERDNDFFREALAIAGMRSS